MNESTQSVAARAANDGVAERRVPPSSGDPEVLERLGSVETPAPLREPVDAVELEHRAFDTSEFWRRIPAFADVDEKTFLDAKWQNRNSVTRAAQLDEVLDGVVDPAFLADVHEGMRVAPMSLRLSPYVLAVIDWDHPYDDPVRRQFIPVASTRLPDHPMLTLDSLREQDDSPTPGLVHRYQDKALFLALDVCPVYCRFCTRSYAIGLDTEEVEKVQYKTQPDRWEKIFAYIASRPELEDIVISGGDVYHLSPGYLAHIGETLLGIPHIRRIRFASKGPAVMPMKILSDTEWTDTLVRMVDEGRRRSKEVALHTHYNTWHEITDISRRAMDHLFRRGVKVRNQAVLIRGVNDDVADMRKLVRQLAYMNVQPYYVYQHDLVSGVEELRTRIGDTLEIERGVRGSTAGFNTPTFVVDAPGGGGKRDVHSYDHYDPVTGVSVYRSPAVDDGKVYLYFDPLDTLPEAGRERWADPAQHRAIVQETLQASGYPHLDAMIPEEVQGT